MKDCSPWHRAKLEQHLQGCGLWEGPHAGGEEGAAETKIYEPISIAIPHPAYAAEGSMRRKEAQGSEAEPGSMYGGSGGKGYFFVHVCYTAILLVIGNELE